jgi:large subunit ribosomal protein L23
MPPTFASFKVPLSFNKFDMRDYLYHAYNVAAVQVRSTIFQRTPRRNAVTHRIGRPPSVKYMHVEMTEPFVWPDPPNEQLREKWETQEDRARKEAQAVYRRRNAHYKRGEIPSKAEEKMDIRRELLKQQALSLMRKETKWENTRPLDPRWKEEKTA